MEKSPAPAGLLLFIAFILKQLFYMHLTYIGLNYILALLLLLL